MSRSATSLTPRDAVTWSRSTEATVTSAPALRNTSMMATASISSVPSPMGTSTFLIITASATNSLPPGFALAPVRAEMARHDLECAVDRFRLHDIVSTLADLILDRADRNTEARFAEERDIRLPIPEGDCLFGPDAVLGEYLVHDFALALLANVDRNLPGTDIPVEVAFVADHPIHSQVPGGVLVEDGEPRADPDAGDRLGGKPAHELPRTAAHRVLMKGCHHLRPKNPTPERCVEASPLIVGYLTSTPARDQIPRLLGHA